MLTIFLSYSATHNINNLSCRIRKGLTPGSTVCEFRMYQSPRYNTVVLTPQEFRYWVPGGTPPDPYFPCLITITSEWDTHKVLLETPTGVLSLANRKPDWEKDLSKALSDCLSYPGISGEHQAWWREFIGCASRGGSAATGLFRLSDREFFDREASLLNLGPYRRDDFFLHAGTAAREVLEAGAQAPYRRTVNSSLQKAPRWERL